MDINQTPRTNEYELADQKSDRSRFLWVCILWIAVPLFVFVPLLFAFVWLISLATWLLQT